MSRYLPTKSRIWKAWPAHVSQALKIAKEMKNFNLKAAKKIETKFDPFRENVSSIRDFVYYSSAEKYRQTNPKCVFKIDVCNDRSEPLIKVSLESNQILLFKTENLTTLELLQLFNKHVSSLFKPEQEVTPVITKASKAKRH